MLVGRRMGMRCVRAQNVIKRTMRKSRLLVPIGAGAARIDGLYTLNRHGSPSLRRQAVETSFGNVSGLRETLDFAGLR